MNKGSDQKTNSSGKSLNSDIKTNEPEKKSVESKTAMWVIIMISLIFILLLFLLSSNFFLSSNYSTLTDDVTNLNDDVLLVETQTQNLEIKTTDLTYANSNSAFTNNLTVGGSLTVGGKNVSSIISGMSSDGVTTTFSTNVVVENPKTLYVENLNVAQEINDLNEYIDTGIRNTESLILNTLNVSGQSTQNGIANSGNITTNTLNSDAISSTTISSSALNSTSIDCSGAITTNTLGSLGINCSGTISSDISYANFFDGTFSARVNLVPGYAISALGSGEVNGVYPIVGTMRKMYPYRVDDFWIVNPGFTFEVFTGDNYSGTASSYAGDSIVPVSYPSLYVNQCSSIKVYFKGSIWIPLGTLS